MKLQDTRVKAVSGWPRTPPVQENPHPKLRAGGATTEALNRARLPFCWLRFLRSSLRRGNNRVSHPGVQLACARRERETATRRANDGKTARAPWESASVPGTPVNGTIHAPWGFCSSYRRPADGRTARHAARRAARSGSSMVHALSSQVLSSATSSWASSVHCACLRRPPSSDGLRAANTGSTGSTADAVDGPERGGGRRSRVDLLAAFARCVEIKILRRVRAESSRRPPRHRRDARSMAWQCGLSPLDSAGTAAFSPRKGFDID